MLVLYNNNSTNNILLYVQCVLILYDIFNGIVPDIRINIFVHVNAKRIGEQAGQRGITLEIDIAFFCI